jgi:hypothetical protein
MATHASLLLRRAYQPLRSAGTLAAAAQRHTAQQQLRCFAAVNTPTLKPSAAGSTGRVVVVTSGKVFVFCCSAIAVINLTLLLFYVLTDYSDCMLCAVCAGWCRQDNHSSKYSLRACRARAQDLRYRL